MWSGKKIGNKEFDIRLENEFPNLVRLSDYINARTTIIFSCKRCKKQFKKKPKELSKIKCSCEEREIKYKESIKNKEIELIEKYINIREKILHKCKKCNLLFKSSPKSILNSKIGCTSCSGRIFSIDKYKSLLPSNLKLISKEYIGSNKKHKHLCIDCNFEFITKPNYILHMNTNCPNCSKSKGEREIMCFLNDKKIKYINEYTVNINEKNLRFDFFIEEFNLMIEYDGIQHFKPVDLFGGEESFIKQTEYDILKDKWCLENKIKLLRIPYYENVEKILCIELIK
jgi:very-short-patch-repair endonuclease